MKSIYRFALPLFGLLLGACGTVATPVWSEQAQGTQSALVATADHLTEIPPTATPPLAPTKIPRNAPIAAIVPAPATEAPTETPTSRVEPPTATPQAAAGQVSG